MALRERTRTRLTLVVSGPPPAALTTILSAVRHHVIDPLEAARRHLSTGAPPRSHASNYPWWHRAPVPALTTNPGTRCPHAPGAPPGDPLPPPPPPARHGLPVARPQHGAVPHRADGLTDLAAPSPHHEAVAQRIHTRIAHPVHAAAVAIRALNRLRHRPAGPPHQPHTATPPRRPSRRSPQLGRASSRSRQHPSELQSYTRPQNCPPVSRTPASPSSWRPG